MIRFARGNVKPDTPLLYLLPVFGILLLILIWSALSDFLAAERARAERVAIQNAAGQARGFQQFAGQELRAVDQAARIVQHEFERSRERHEPFDLAAIARRALVPSDTFSLVSVVDRTGSAATVFLPRGGAPALLPGSASLAALDAFRIHRDRDTRRLHVGRPVAGRVVDRTLIPMTRRLNQPDGSFAGVVAVWVDPARFSDAYDATALGRQGVLALVGDDGIVRAFRSGAATAAAANVDFPRLLAPLQRAETGGAAVAGLGDDVARFTAVRSLAPYEAVAVAGVAADEALADHREQRRHYRGYAVAASLTIVGVLAIAMLLVIRMKQSHREAEAARATYRAAAEGSLDAFFLLRACARRMLTDSVAPGPHGASASSALQALGMRTGGLLTNGEATSELLLDAAEAAAEDFWELPITEHTREQLKSTVADMKSGAGHRWGGALVAAAFLERFVPDGVAWGHLDIAGPAENPDAAYGCVPKGGTGAGVRTLVSLAGLLER